jgi:GTP diphosphokinase / guanosine-3',5'-bis(diphosphate) 3'-diphosphatase
MATVDRVRSWRRSSTPTHANELTPLLDAYRAMRPKARLDNIIAAYDLAAEAHREQNRSSGEKYINHPLAVARIVSDIGLDEASVVAALIHDVVEDTHVSLAEVEERFGADVAMLVDGVTKIDRISFDSKEEQQAATMRKMLVAMARDTRVLLIKLADRLHNMRTIAGVSSEKQERKASETLDIYAPLANRLGMQQIRQELEDLSFAAMYPKRYAELDHMVAVRTPERDLYVARLVADVKSKLAGVDIDASITGRSKNLWSIWEKMQIKGRAFTEIFDLVALRVVVRTQRDCYAALGTIHLAYQPVIGRFKDYIALPKYNLYRSLHTTIMGPDGRAIEVQIRTVEMHEVAENGVAAHWSYKSGSAQDELAWLSRLADRPVEGSDPSEFLDEIKRDLDQGEISVFTPKGQAVSLPTGSTPVDFAYAVHTEVGHSCIGARVNGDLVRLDTKLEAGQTVQIVLRQVDSGGPNKEWLEFVASTRARHKIRQWFSRERKSDLLEQGREEMSIALRGAGLPVQRLLEGPQLVAEATALGFSDTDALLVAVGDDQVDAGVVVEQLLVGLQSGNQDELLSSTVAPSGRLRNNKSEVGIHVEGFDGVMVRLSRCCTPVPGDEIIGFLTRGRGISVHRTDCANAESLEQVQTIRLVDVEWDEQRARSRFVASIEVQAYDRTGLLRDVADALSQNDLNIVSSSTTTGVDRICKMRFDIEMGDPAHIQATLRNVRGLDGVFDAYRHVPGTPNGSGRVLAADGA